MSLEMKPCVGLGGGGTADSTKNCIVDTSTGDQEEITSMETLPNGDTIYYTTTSSGAPKGTAMIQKGYRRNADGDLYSVYGSGGVVKQINNPQPYAGTPVTSADPQVFKYLTDSAPGAVAFRKMNNYVGGWWMNIFGLKKEDAPIGQESNEISSEVIESEKKKIAFTAGSLLIGGYGIYHFFIKK